LQQQIHALIDALFALIDALLHQLASHTDIIERSMAAGVSPSQ
jgi:hypothetical protein